MKIPPSLFAYFLLCCIAYLSTVVAGQNPGLRSSVAHEEACYDRLSSAGIHGTPKPNALLTFLITPKSITHSDEKNEQHLRHLMFGWSLVPDVNFVILTRDCRVIDYAIEYGLLTLTDTSGSEVQDMTYQYLFLTILKFNLGAPFVGFSNADISYDKSLPDTMRALIKYQNDNNVKVSAVGKRYNADVPLDYFTPIGEEVSKSRWEKIIDHIHKKNEPFIAASQDYFIFSKDSNVILQKLNELPPMFVGGVAFDNYFTTVLKRIEREHREPVFDTSRSVWAMHINHHKDARKSHSNVASEYNRMMMDKVEWGYNRRSRIKLWGMLNELNHKTKFDENGVPITTTGAWG